jgi:CheY-like chemotaxis protein
MSLDRNGGPPRVVLLVEDDRLMADTMRQVLEGAGYDARLAFTGGEAVKVAGDLRPAAIICDIGLPGMTGWEVAGAVRGDLKEPHTYMIALSGYGFEEDRLRSLQ